jgi:hypothetical protein
VIDATDAQERSGGRDGMVGKSIVTPVHMTTTSLNLKPSLTLRKESESGGTVVLRLPLFVVPFFFLRRCEMEGGQPMGTRLRL